MSQARKFLREPAVSGYDMFRRRIAPIAFGIAIAFIAYDSCQKKDRTHATFVLDFGAYAQDVRAVEAEIWMNGEQVTEFRRSALEGGQIGVAKFTASLPDTDGEIRVKIDLPTAQRMATRRIHVAEAATVTVPLQSDLAP